MDDSHKEWRRKRYEDGEEIDRLYEGLCRSIDGSALPDHLTDDAATLAGRIDSHLHDMAATKQEYDTDAVRRRGVLRHVLELTGGHLPDGLGDRLASLRRQDTEAEQRRTRIEERWAHIAAQQQGVSRRALKRPRMGGEPLEVLSPRRGWRSNGWRELRLYSEGLELEAKRPKRFQVAAWVDIAGFGTSPNRIGVLLHDGVPVTRLERFELRFGHVHLNIPAVFLSSRDELLEKLWEYHRRSRA